MWINDRLESRDNMNGLEILEHTILIVMDEDKKHLIKSFNENDLSCPKMFTITEFIDKYYFSCIGNNIINLVNILFDLFLIRKSMFIMILLI